MQISWLVELIVRPGQLARFEQLTGEMVAAAQQETGVLGYQRFVGDDESSVVVYERYADFAAAIAHLLQFEARFAPRFSQMADRKRFLVFGRPNAELKALLDRYRAAYLAPLGPFPYWG